MRYFSIIICSVFLALFVSCKGENAEPNPTTDPVEAEIMLELYNIALSSSEVQTIEVGFQCNTKVEISSDRSWCQPTISSSEAVDGKLKIAIECNTGRFERSARVKLSCGEVSKEVNITQPRGVYSAGMHYELPVVFHLVYSDENNTQHNIPADKIYEIFDNLQTLYKECGEDVNFDFVLAEEDEEGNTLAEPGIHRIKQTLARMECMKVMSDVTGKYKKLGWDPRRYLNITIYEFSDSFAIMGLSRAPYLIKPHSCEGVMSLSQYVDLDDMSYLYSISLNNAYLEPKNPQQYNMYNFSATVGHEIGHYLGLLHPFSETLDSNGLNNTGDDTDYCTDTPTYNKYLYDNLVYEMYAACGGNFSDEQIEELSYRTACCDEPYEFRSTNIMDYAVGDANRFTAQQVERMRYVLENSPYIPGVKSVDFEATKSTGAVAGDIPLNIME